LLALVVAGLAWWTSHQKLRLDLYNRRFDVYSRTLDFFQELSAWKPTELEKISTSFQVSPELRTTQRAFIKAKMEARFLFREDSGIQELLEQMHIDTIWIFGYNRNSQQLKTQTEMMLSGFREFTERSARIHESIPLLEKKLEDYLDFRAVGRARKRWWA